MTILSAARLALETGKELIEAIAEDKSADAAILTARYMELYQQVRSWQRRTALPGGRTKLAVREQQVIDLAKAGIDTKGIGVMLDMKTNTVKAHLRNARMKARP